MKSDFNKVLVDDPGQDRLINELYVWVSVDPRTQLEGIMGLSLGPGGVMQAVSSDKGEMWAMAAEAKEVCRRAGKQAKLVRFRSAEIIPTP